VSDACGLAVLWLLSTLSPRTVAELYDRGYRDGMHEVRDGMAAHLRAEAAHVERQRALDFSNGFAAGLRAAGAPPTRAGELLDVPAAPTTWKVPPARRPA
jgi:hypothetical protein